MAKGNNQTKESKGKPKKDAKAKTDTTTGSRARSSGVRSPTADATVVALDRS